jgi:hypothetical protein
VRQPDGDLFPRERVDQDEDLKAAVAYRRYAW